MNEEFDDRLKSRITDAFDNYEDDSAQEGWLLLREKYPEKAKSRPVLWLWWAGAAAVLLTALGLGLWLGNKPMANTWVQTKHTIQKPTKDFIDPITDSAKNSTNTVGKFAASKQLNTPVVTENRVATSKPFDTSAVDDNQLASGTPQILIKTKHTKASVNNLPQQYIANDKVRARRDKQAKSPKATTEHEDKVNGHNSDAQVANNQQETPTQPLVKTIDTAVLATNNAKPVTPIPNETVKPIIKKPDHPIFTAQHPNEVKTLKTVDGKVKFGVYAATYFNYAKGSDNEFNVGAGLLAEIKLIGNLKLSTGLAINQNSLNYQSALPQKASGYLTASIAHQSAGESGKFAAADPVGTNFYTVSTSLNLQNYQASLFGLDIPVNLKYQFAKSDTYVSAGVSSGTYINETYSFVYNYSSAVINAQNQNTKTQTSFNTFDFARTLNLSFGVGYPLGKSNRLIIEPFVKYPLDGLGSQDLKFGAGGVNLKLNFSTRKK